VIWRREAALEAEGLREYLASTAAYLNDRPGRAWRDLEDAAISAQTLYGGRTAGNSWRRSVDYYDESTLIWLEVDTLIREKTGGKNRWMIFAGHSMGRRKRAEVDSLHAG